MLSNAIEYLMHDPSTKTPSRLKMEQDFFEQSGGLSYMRTEGGTKHLILTMDELSIVHNGFVWLALIYENLLSSLGEPYTILVPSYGISITTSADPVDVIYELRQEHIRWEVGATYETFICQETLCGSFVDEGSKFVVSVVMDGGDAISNTGHIYPLSALVYGGVSKCL